MSRSVSAKPLPATSTDRERQELARCFDIQGLRLTADGRLLVLDGEVPCYRMKKLAGQAVGRLAGALQVVNRLRVVPQGHRRDSEVAEAVQAALRTRANLTDQDIAVSACDGIVRLQGSVSCPAVRCEAESTVWDVGGVVDVENRLCVGRARASHGRPGADNTIPPNASISSWSRMSAMS